MRKVYHPTSNSIGLAISVAGSVALTLILFGAIPFAHRVATPRGAVELVKLGEFEKPPEEEKEPEKAQEEPEKKEEKPPEPVLTDAPIEIALPYANLEIASGTGGAFWGSGESEVKQFVEDLVTDTVDVSELQKRPEPVSTVNPVYPEALKKAKVEGLVTLVFVLSEEGRVEDPRVENSTRSEFDKPALDAIRKWRFRPGEKDGAPVRTFIRQALRFRVPST